MQRLKSAVAILLVVPVFGAEKIAPATDGLTAHEWGTFTSVATETGEPSNWMPLSGSNDLPCFVYHLANRNVKILFPRPLTISGTVRMETPVLYFYTPRPATLSVRVDFPQGWITEWYPQASAVSPGDTTGPLANGRIEWRDVQLRPGEQLPLLTGKGASHYYAARATDAAPLRINQQNEKMIFYRGIADFLIPLQPTLAENRKVTLRNVGPDAIPGAILFENRGGKIGYRVIHRLVKSTEVEMPELTSDLGSLRVELARTLVEMGLFRQEALAMIETWRDSWFEEGLRVFYIVPRPMVDAVLPLGVTPAPISTARVFVGRVEMLSPAMESTLATALQSGDLPALEKYGRFLDPFRRQIERKNPGVAESLQVETFVQAKRDAAARLNVSQACVQ